MTGESSRGVNGSIAIVLNGGLPLTLTATGVNTSFFYMPNPIITNINRNIGPISGGTIIEIIGEHLTSISRPEITVTVVVDLVKHVVKQVCGDVQPEKMLCPAPNITELIQAILVSQNLTHLNSTAINKEFDFGIGVKLDGVDEFENLTEALPNNPRTNLKVVNDIELGRLQPDIFYANTWMGIVSISIPIKTPSEAVTKDDLNVKVGEGVCRIKDMFTNAVICRV
ncbi:unnamed protein product, partial [Owenia fusiformis]